MWDDEWGRMQYARTAEFAAEHQGGAAHMRWGGYQDDGLDMGGLLEEGGDGHGFAAGGADVAGNDADGFGWDAELMQDGEAVVDAAGHVQAVGFDQFVVVYPELRHDDDWCEVLVVDICHLQLPFGRIAQQHHDSIGRLQGFLMHQPVPAAPEEEEQEQQGGEGSQGYEKFFAGQLSEL